MEEKSIFTSLVIGFGLDDWGRLSIFAASNHKKYVYEEKSSYISAEDNDYEKSDDDNDGSPFRHRSECTVQRGDIVEVYRFFRQYHNEPEEQQREYDNLVVVRYHL